MTLALPTDQPDAVSRVPLHIRLSAWMIDRARRCHRARWEAHDAETAARFPPPPLQPLAAQPSISSVRPLSGDQPLEFGADQKIVWLRPGLQPRTVPVVPARQSHPPHEAHSDDLAHCRSLQSKERKPPRRGEN